jgi:hypothetical protein
MCGKNLQLQVVLLVGNVVEQIHLSQHTTAVMNQAIALLLTVRNSIFPRLCVDGYHLMLLQIFWFPLR